MKKKVNKKFAIGGSVIGAAILGAGIIVPQFIEKVDVGHVGIVYSANGGVQDKALDQGWHLIGLFDKAIEYPVKLRTVSYDDMVVSTKDGKNIKIDLSYTYKVDRSQAVAIFNEFGNIGIEDVENSYLQKRMLDAARTTVSKYNLLDIYGEHASEAGAEIQKAFEKDVAELGFIVSDVALGAPKPDKNTQQAIDARIAAAQENERKKLELENEKIQKEIKTVQAEAEAEQKRIAAEAEAEALRLKSAEISDKTLQKEWIEKWNGVLPSIQTGEGSGLILNIPEQATTDKK